MPLRNFLIRFAADALYALRTRALTSGNGRLIVFTGTSGKTLARTATAHALKKAGAKVVSPPFGYTNELGIVLAMLGIAGPLRLLSPHGVRRALTESIREPTFVLVEIGADWRMDVPWLTRRFPVAGIGIASIDTDEWARRHEDILRDKVALARALEESGFICWSTSNPSASLLTSSLAAAGADKAAFYTADAGKGEVRVAVGDKDWRFDVLVEPGIYAEAIGMATVFLEALGLEGALNERLFTDYAPPAERFRIRTLASGGTLITDTYKSVPFCMSRVLSQALSQRASKRIAVVTPMHPVHLNQADHYERMGALLSKFDAVYLVGFSTRLKDHLKLTKPAADIAPSEIGSMLSEEGTEGVLVVVKGAGRYGLTEHLKQY